MMMAYEGAWRMAWVTAGCQRWAGAPGLHPPYEQQPQPTTVVWGVSSPSRVLDGMMQQRCWQPSVGL